MLALVGCTEPVAPVREPTMLELVAKVNDQIVLAAKAGITYRIAAVNLCTNADDPSICVQQLIVQRVR